MKPQPILNVAKGLDVVSLEGAMPAGTARTADNIVLGADGGFKRRDGYVIDLSLAGASSLWAAKQQQLTLVKAGSTLYRLTGKVGALVATAVQTGLPSGFDCAYSELAGSVNFSCGDTLLRLDPDGIVRRPGVASMMGFAPTLTAIAGGLPAGKYAVAITAVNDLGEESGASMVADLELTGSGGIAVAFAGAPAADSYRVYRTTANGDVLYRAEHTTSASVNLVGGDVGMACETWLREPMPAGDYMDVYNGRAYNGRGRFLFYSEAFNPGLYNPRDGWIAFEGDIATVLALDTGIWVGTTAGVIFLQGGGPNQFEFVATAGNAVIPGSGAVVNASLFSAELTQGAKQVAVWLTPLGIQIGLATGQVVTPQQDRIALTAARGITAAFLRDGVHQLVTAVDDMTLGSGGAADSTP